jgi:hypothetical protein
LRKRVKIFHESYLRFVEYRPFTVEVSKTQANDNRRKRPKIVAEVGGRTGQTPSVRARRGSVGTRRGSYARCSSALIRFSVGGWLLKRFSSA